MTEQIGERLLAMKLHRWKKLKERHITPARRRANEEWVERELLEPVASHPVTDIKRHATKIIAKSNRTRRPVFISVRGRSAAVLLDIDTYERLLSRLDVLAGLAVGERAFAEGRVRSHASAKKRLRRDR